MLENKEWWKNYVNMNNWQSCGGFKIKKYVSVVGYISVVDWYKIFCIEFGFWWFKCC